MENQSVIAIPFLLLTYSFGAKKWNAKNGAICFKTICSTEEIVCCTQSGCTTHATIHCVDGT